MSETIKPLWLHAYSGKENGLMIVGDQASLNVLARQLLLAAEIAGSEKNALWPPTIARPEVVGPYEDSADFTLSFHLEGNAPLSKILPLRRRRNVGGAALLAIAVGCSLVGAFSIFQWVSTYLF